VNEHLFDSVGKPFIESKPGAFPIAGATDLRKLGENSLAFDVDIIPNPLCECFASQFAA